MKKLCISFLSCVIIILSAIGLSLETDGPHTEYLRIHIRANSNLETDQSVKYSVKDAVVDYLTPYLAKCDTKLKAENVLRERLSEIESVADSVLMRNGFSYTSEAVVKNEKFPTRTYDDITLDCGYYDALIIELGDGKGDNWWCVVYPPLCFTDGNAGYVYRSKILDIIKDFYKREN